MGIFDNLSNLSPEQTQGLLAAAAQILKASGPSRVPTGFGQIAGAGLEGFQGGYDAATQRKMQLEQAAQSAQLHGLQIQGLTGELQDKDIARQQQLAAQKVYRDFQGGQSSPTAAAQSLLGSNMAPTIDNAAKLTAGQNAGAGQQQPDEYTRRLSLAGALRAQGLFPQADAVEQQALKFKPEFDQTPRVGLGPDGKPFSYVLDKSGNQKRLDGVLPRDELHFQDTGGGYAGLDKFTGQQMISGKKTMTPGESASNGIAGQRLAFDKLQAGKPIFNENAGGFVLPPSAQNPNGKVLSVDGLPGKPLTESQGKASLYVSRMSKADQIMNDLSAAGTNNTSAIKSTLESVPLIGNSLGQAGNYAASPPQQKLEQAQRDFVNAVLRQESGASISPTEFESAQKQYFPQRGDSPEVLAQKAENRQTAIQGMVIQAGPGADKVGVSATSSKPAQAKSKIIKLDGGGSASATLGTDGNYYVQRGGKTYRVEE